MRNFTILILLLTLAFTGSATTWTITDAGFSFSPSMLTIQEGDDVNFDIDMMHNSVEVSESTWNMNGITPLPGGWSLSLGGGHVPASFLEPGIHYYVCQPHAAMGMKGIIVVEQTTATDVVKPRPSLAFYPNPSTGTIHMLLDSDAKSQDARIAIFDMQGNQVYSVANFVITENEEMAIELRGLSKGVYIVRLYDEKGIRSRKLVLQ